MLIDGDEFFCNRGNAVTGEFHLVIDALLHLLQTPRRIVKILRQILHCTDVGGFGCGGGIGHHGLQADLGSGKKGGEARPVIVMIIALDQVIVIFSLVYLAVASFVFPVSVVIIEIPKPFNGKRIRPGPCTAIGSVQAKRFGSPLLRFLSRKPGGVHIGNIMRGGEQRSIRRS